MSGPHVTRVVVAADGDPLAPKTFSGSSHRLCQALAEHGALAGTVDAKPPWLAKAEQAAAFGRDKDAWHQRYWSGSSPAAPLARRAMTAIGRRAVARVAPPPDAVLQISGWFDARPPGSSALLATYQDANGTLWTQRPDLVLDPQGRALRRSRRAEGETYRRMDLVCTMSRWSARSFVEDYGVDPDRVVPVGAGPNLDALPAAVPERAPGPPRVLFVGRTFGRKGGPDLLQAFGTLKAQHPDATLDLVGPPPGAPQPGVTWHGPVYDRARLGALYAQATVFALPSTYEGFGIPFLEGMAYGLPCIGARVCAVPEVVQDGVTGLLVAPHDPRDLAQALLALADDPARAAALGAAGRAAAAREWTWPRTAEKVLQAIEARLSGR